jgi:hypothetical protein
VWLLLLLLLLLLLVLYCCSVGSASYCYSALLSYWLCTCDLVGVADEEAMCKNANNIMFVNQPLPAKYNFSPKMKSGLAIDRIHHSHLDRVVAIQTVIPSRHPIPVSFPYLCRHIS